MSKKVLALYDFSSKQEYIYRTSKIREISGASLLMGEMYKKFAVLYEESGKGKFVYNLEETFQLNKSNHDAEFNPDAEVLYDGGGNLMVVYKDRQTYVEANKIFSKYLAENCPGLNMIASCVEVTETFDSIGSDTRTGDRDLLYKKNAEIKNRCPAFDIPAVTPVTLIDPMTFLPVTYKRSNDLEGEISLSSDRYSKRKAFEKSDNKADNLEDLEGLTAVIYIDGNSMGKKLMGCRSDEYDKGVAALREFSENTNNAFVVNTLAAIEKKIKSSDNKGYRRVIGGGDEITIICDARIVYEIIKVYFEELKQSGAGNTACAGIAIFPAKSPFNVAYDIAEAACESAKKRAHKENGNYFDFYFCHAGIVNDFDSLRKKEDAEITARPYEFDWAVSNFDEYGEKLRKAGRANVKALGDAALLSYEKYRFEVRRVNAYLKENLFEGNEKEMKIVYDMAEVYDLWFAKEENKNEENS